MVYVEIPVINKEGNRRDYLDHERSAECWQVQGVNIKHKMILIYVGSY